MNYIAEPYVALVDQLLTGLTGGETREVHQFFPKTPGYSLSRSFSEVKVNTIKVLGQSSEAFLVFIPGRDWQFTTKGKIKFLTDTEDALLPGANAIWPDEGSEFFVSYYHHESDNALLTDRNVGSLTRTLAEAFSRELAVLEKQLEMVYQSGFIDTANGTALDQVVALLGLTRKGGDYAGGTVRLYRESAAPGDIYIPADTKLSTNLNPPVSFVTTSDRTLRKGQLSVEATVRSEVAGATGVVAASAINIINKAIHGITAVTNDAPTLFSGEKESDQELRLRAKSVMERAGRATKGAIVNAITSGAGLKENDIKLVEDFQGHPGLVKLFIAREPDAALAANVDNALLASRPAGVRFEHNLQNTISIDNRVAVSDEDLREESAFEVSMSSSMAGDDFRLPINCNILIYPENTRLTADEKTRLKNSIVTAVFDHVDSTPIGGAIIFNQLIVTIMAQGGIRDIVLDLYPSEDVTQKGRRNLIVPDGQRAVFLDKQTDIQVLFVGAPVYFDFRFSLGLKVANTLAAAELEIKQKLVSYFSTAPATIDSSGIQAQLQPSDVFTLTEADQHWTVEYEQAGLMIKELDETMMLSPEEQAVLRKITTEEKKT
ncbi:baseplate J/gp47 family protein [Desulfobacula sp.]|uniref:baseplate J/gp47 family protein n=1 Tax=Desulfobacula sp. TaxID=2593537 RepID=UPI0026168707|nr:baseplate J/gp47 family protein [Desulfobacula sp.]